MDYLTLIQRNSSLCQKSLYSLKYKIRSHLSLKKLENVNWISANTPVIDFTVVFNEVVLVSFLVCLMSILK